MDNASPGQTVVFAAGGKVLCRSVTDAAGVATGNARTAAGWTSTPRAGPIRSRPDGSPREPARERPTDEESTRRHLAPNLASAS